MKSEIVGLTEIRIDELDVLRRVVVADVQSLRGEIAHARRYGNHVIANVRVADLSIKQAALDGIQAEYERRGVAWPDIRIGYDAE